MIAGWPGGGGNRTLADLVFSEARYFLRDLNVLLSVVLLELRGGTTFYVGNSSSSAFASFRSRVSNPSVNHP